MSDLFTIWTKSLYQWYTYGLFSRKVLYSDLVQYLSKLQFIELLH